MDLVRKSFVTWLKNLFVLLYEVDGGVTSGSVIFFAFFGSWGWKKAKGRIGVTTCLNSNSEGIKLGCGFSKLRAAAMLQV